MPLCGIDVHRLLQHIVSCGERLCNIFFLIPSGYPGCESLRQDRALLFTLPEGDLQ